MGFKTSDKGIKLIQEFEGLRLNAYKAVPSEKYYTIGYGHYSPEVTKDMVITKEKATEYLKGDLAGAERAVNNYNLPWMTQNRFDALVSFTFNCGSGCLKTLLLDGKRTPDTVPNIMIKYNKAGGKTLAGLVRRRNAEADLFKS